MVGPTSASDQAVVGASTGAPDLDAILARARTAFREGAYEEVLSCLQHLHGPEVAALRRDAFKKLGELSRALGELNRVRHVRPGHNLDVEARRLVGQLIETDPTWLPSLPPPSNPGSTPTGSILHFVKESLPYVETGFTFRTRMTLQAQVRAGFQPQVVTSIGFPATKGLPDYPPIEEVDGVPHHRLASPIEDPRRLPADVQTTENALRSAEVADDLQPALVQAGTGYRGYDAALVGLAVARQRDIPFVYEVRGFQEQTWTPEQERSTKGEYYRRRRAQEDRCMREATAVITIAHSMRAEIIERGIPEDRVHVVPNAVDTERFAPRGKNPELLARYELKDRFVLGYISNLGRREGIRDLLQAVGILLARGHDVSCLVVGDGPEKARLKHWAHTLDLGRAAVFTGHVLNDRIEDHYALIDLFVVPRIDDRASRLVTPLKPLEAMSMRLPIIASALPALEELVAPESRGRVFPPSDPVALADVAESLILDEGTRMKFADEGHEWVKRERTLDSNVVRYGAILRPLIGD